MASALAAALLSYAVLREMGVLAGRFFLSLSAVATTLVCTLVLGEKLTLWGMDWNSVDHSGSAFGWKVVICTPE